VEVTFSTPFHTSPEAHPTSCTVGTGSFLGVNWLGHSADHPPPSNARVANGFELNFCLPSLPAETCQG